MNTPANLPTRLVKVVQCPLQRRAKGSLSLRFGEPAVYNAIVRRAAGGAAELDAFVKDHGELISSVLDTRRFGRVTLDADHDSLVFLPNRVNIMDDEYHEPTFVEHFTSLAGELSGQDVTLVCSTPGAFDRPDEGERRRRWRVIADIAEAHGVPLTFRFAPADLPRDSEELADVSALSGLKLRQSDLVLVGNRELARNNERRNGALARAAEAILEAARPERVVTPVAVGMSLAIAEQAVARNVPVLLVYFSDTEQWIPDTQARLSALLQSPLVSTAGEPAYSAGKITATVRKLSELASEAGALQVVIDDPAGSEARLMKGARNWWHHVQSFLKADEEQPPVAAPPPPAEGPTAELPF